jgi:glutaredoxin
MNPLPQEPKQAHSVVLYSRKNCHLCDDAAALLRQYGLNPVTVDIDTDPALKKRFDTCVPVVEIDGKIRFRGHVHPLLLRRLLNRRQARDGIEQGD